MQVIASWNSSLFVATLDTTYNVAVIKPGTKPLIEPTREAQATSAEDCSR